MSDQTKKLQDSFLKVIVKECSIFFYNLHKFCLDYEKKLGLDDNKQEEVQPQMIQDRTKKIKKKQKRINKSPYLRFFLEFKNEIKNEKGNQKLDGKSLSKLASQKWKQMTDEQKQQYYIQNDEQKEAKIKEVKSQNKKDQQLIY